MPVFACVALPRKSMSGNSVNWESRYLENDTPWDQGEPAPPLLQYLERNNLAGSICVPGCGTGHDVRALAESGAKVTGWDIAPSAIARARSFEPVNREHYMVADFFNPSPQWYHTFDMVFEHTCFCAIDPGRREEYVRSCLKVLKPGGQLLAIFFMNPETEPGAGPPFGTTESELDQLFQPHFELLDDYVPDRSFPGREGRERLRLLRRWD